MPSIDFEAINEGILNGISKKYFNSFYRVFEEQLCHQIAEKHISTIKPGAGKVTSLLVDYATQNKREVVYKTLGYLATGDGDPISCMFMYNNNAIWLPALNWKDGDKVATIMIYRLEESTQNNKRILKLNKVDSVKIPLQESVNLLDW